MATPAVIKLSNVTKTYQVGSQTIHALRGVTLTIEPGTVRAIVGKSGAGKSTLMHIIGMLDVPSSGTVQIGGVAVSALSDDQMSSYRNRLVGFVFQSAFLLPEFSALENVMMPGLISGGTHQDVGKRASRLLDAVGLSKRQMHRPGELSGGEQQRVAIARALLMAPPILLADEPTGNLDTVTSRAIQDLLLSIAAEQKATMLLVTHDTDLAGRISGQIVLDDGQVVREVS